MEREIKFRGKTVDGRWLHGDLIHHGTNMSIMPKEVLENTPIDWIGNAIIEHIVIPDTVGQYIGHNDNQGREIYEGDVFTVNGKYPKIVTYKKLRDGFSVANTNDLYLGEGAYGIPSKDWWDEFAHEIRVIGNIYDDSSLTDQDNR